MRALRRHASLLQELLDRFRSLARAVLILDQSETHMALTERTESDARRHCYQRFIHQQLRKFERPFGTVLFRNRRPNEHGGLRGATGQPARSRPVISTSRRF